MTTSQEPVPAIDQAGEVDPKIAGRRLLEAVAQSPREHEHQRAAFRLIRQMDGAYYDPAGYGDDWLKVLVALAANQLATSNPDHRHPGWTDAGHKWLDAGCPPVVTDQPATSLEVEGTLANPSTFGKPTFSLAATPTPPILSEDLREALELLRRREVQMMGAAISTRNWHDMETAYNAGRDRLDAVLVEIRRALRVQGPK